MVNSASTSASLKEYLKRYESNNEELTKKKKKKVKKAKPASSSVLVVDEDPVWQKPINLVPEEDSADEADLVVDEDLEVKCMKRLEHLRARRPYNSIADDGSGWVSLSPKQANLDHNHDIPSPVRTQFDIHGGDFDRSLQMDMKHESITGRDTDLSPPRKCRVSNDSSLGLELNASGKLSDLSPPRKQQKRHHSISSEIQVQPTEGDASLSPPRRKQKHSRSSTRSPEAAERPASFSGQDSVSDLTPPRKNLKNNRTSRSLNGEDAFLSRKSEMDSSTPSSSTKQKFYSLHTGSDSRIKEVDHSLSGRDVEPVYRDKDGKRISRDEYWKSKRRPEKKLKEKKLEWSKGLAQKREEEARLHELELEKNRPFARSRVDPELDKMLRERVRWGDTMAHLVKKTKSEPVLPNLGDDEKMKESGFIIPQDIPSHSWIKRGLHAVPNRYSIAPGRHWDGVDRSNGFEKQLFRRSNEKKASEREAYLWSVSEM